MDNKEQPDMQAAVFGTWDGQKRKPGLLERVLRIENMLKVSIPILVAKAFGVPTDFLSKFFADGAHGVGFFTSHAIAFLVGVPK